MLKRRQRCIQNVAARSADPFTTILGAIVGASWGSLGTLLGLSVGLVGATSGLLEGPPWRRLATFSGHLRGHLGGLGCQLGDILRALGPLSG